MHPHIVPSVHLDFCLKPIMLKEFEHLTLCSVIDPSGTKVIDAWTILLRRKSECLAPTRSVASTTAQENPAA